MSHYQGKFDINNPDTPLGKCLTPFQRKLLQKSLQEDLPESYRQRINIMLLADEGKSQAEICQTLGCSPATARHWMHVAHAGMAHQWQDCPIGRPKAVNDQYLERLKELVNHSPRDYGYPFGRWTGQWLSKHLAKELGISVSDRNVNLLLKKMGLSTRPKSDSTPEITDLDSTKGSRITIGDLQFSSESELPWSLNFIKTSN
ncbi:helix-turn-helix domain-containing protein [Coleofasciculus sp. FACHB-1120]|uniref:helix-turn-helix domain-containing protein n=1 Tax=Coleofasciculus sp. FACHB-1120 TaxID=2692783 RepID=UPI0016824AD0|nr:helix-turn-helix domain-containing protein [Coleofasciculus sp. FACHB-1120]MBD2744716.1 helix-turn-helix domain-containing protein [Coleofasciculus sp. FACHB-1120]